MALSWDVYLVKDDKLGVGNLSGGVISTLAASKAIRYRGISLDDPWGSGYLIDSADLIIGSKYIIIASSAIDFTTLGAADSNVGTIFTCTASATMTSVDNVKTYRAITDEPTFPARFHRAIVTYIFKEKLATIKVRKIDKDSNVVDVTGDMIAASFHERKWKNFIRSGRRYASTRRIGDAIVPTGPNILAVE